MIDGKTVGSRLPKIHKILKNLKQKIEFLKFHNSIFFAGSPITALMNSCCKNIEGWNYS